MHKYKCIKEKENTSNSLAMETVVVEATSGHRAVKSLRDKKTPLILFISRHAHNGAAIFTVSSEL